MQQNGVRASDSVVLNVVEAVANAAGTDPMRLEPPLNEVVDPDALERLVEGDALARVSFEYDGRTVAVDGDGTVTVDGIAATGGR